MSILLQCLASLYFSDSGFVAGSDGNGSGAAALDTILVIVICLCLTCTLALFVLVLLEMQFRTSTIRTMSKGIAKVVLLVQKKLTEKQAAFIHVLEDGLAQEGQGKSGQTVKFSLLHKAVITALQDGASTTWLPSPDAIRALLCVLKMVNGDDDVHSHFLSDKMRESVAGDDGVPLSMVRLANHGLTEHSPLPVPPVLAASRNLWPMPTTSIDVHIDTHGCSFVLSWAKRLARCQLRPDGLRPIGWLQLNPVWWERR